MQLETSEELFWHRVTSDALLLDAFWYNESGALRHDMSGRILVEEMRANGMKINEVDIELFKARVEPVYTEYYEKYGDLFEQLCETIRSIQ